MNIGVVILLILAFVIDLKLLNRILVPFKLTLLTLGVITLTIITMPCNVLVCLTEYTGTLPLHKLFFLFLTIVAITTSLHRYLKPKVIEFFKITQVMYKNAKSEIKEKEILEEMDEPPQDTSDDTPEEEPKNE